MQKQQSFGIPTAEITLSQQQQQLPLTQQPVIPQSQPSQQQQQQQQQQQPINSKPIIVLPNGSKAQQPAPQQKTRPIGAPPSVTCVPPKPPQVLRETTGSPYSNDTDDSDANSNSYDDNIPLGVTAPSAPSGGSDSSSADMLPPPPEKVDDSDYTSGKAEIVDALIYMYFKNKSVKTLAQFKERYKEFSPAKYGECINSSVGYLVLQYVELFEQRWSRECAEGRVPFELIVYKDALDSIHKAKRRSLVESVFSDIVNTLGNGITTAHRFMFSKELAEGLARARHLWLFDNVPWFAAEFSERLEKAGIVQVLRVNPYVRPLWTDNKLGVNTVLAASFDTSGLSVHEQLTYCTSNCIDAEVMRSCWVMKCHNGNYLMACTKNSDFYKKYSGAFNLSREGFIDLMVNNFVTENYGMCLYSGFHTSRGIERMPNFSRNVGEWGKAVVDACGTAQDPEYSKVMMWFAGFRPVHQCSKEALGSILNLGALASLNKLATIWKSPAEIANCVWLNNKMHRCITELAGTEGFAHTYLVVQNYIRALARKRQSEDSAAKLDELSDMINRGTKIDDVKFGIMVFRCVDPITDAEKENYAKCEKEFRDRLGSFATEITKVANEAISSLMDILATAKGIEFSVDKEIGTDKVVFGILGPNRGTYGNAEAAIIFKNTIMQHPDTFFTPIAAMGFYQGWYAKNCKIK